MKRISKIIVLLCVMVAALACFAACSSSSVTGITINTDNMRLTFIKGEELDLSGGVLTVTTSDGTESVTLTTDGELTEGVTISGYDSEKTGSQTITVEYGGKTATFKINVVNRMTAAGITSEYFVGDEFNKTKGVLRIYRDNGEYFDANMSDDEVTVTNFDSSEAGEREVTLTYKSDTEEYTGTITVTVYDVAEIEINKPNKTNYKSHETAIDLSGGYITITNASGKFSKIISITEDMVSGFDLSEATYENSRNSAYKQTITITYGGKTASFTINITFSDVSVVLLAAATLSTLDWSGSIPEITEEYGALAIDAISLIESLSTDDKSYISDTAYLTIARVASVYGLSEIIGKLQTYRSVLLYDEDSGEIDFISCGIEDAKNDYEALSEDVISDIASQLEYIVTYYGAQTLYGTTTIADYLALVAQYTSSVELLGNLISYYDLFAYSVEYNDDGTILSESGIPSDWSLDKEADHYLDDYSETISYVYSNIIYGDYFSSDYRSAYSLLAEWREDFFTIIYEFWGEIEGGENGTAAIENVSVVYLPYPFDEIDELTTYLYNYYLYIYSYSYYYPAYYSTYYSYDTTAFMYYYKEYMNYVDMVANSSDTVIQVIYANLPIYVLVSGGDTEDESDDEYSYNTISGWTEVFTYSSYAYYGRTYFYSGVDEVDDLWDDYLDIIAMYVESFSEEGFTIDGFVSGEAGTYIAAMFKKFVELTPTQQYAFLRSVNVNYLYGYPVLGLSVAGITDGSSSIYSYFTYFVGHYYYNCLSEDEFTLFSNLITALEYYARRNDFSSNYGMQYFISNMKKAVVLYNELDGTDEDGNILIDAPGVDNFNKHLNFLYNKYTTIYGLYDSNGNYTASTDLGEWEDSFTELATCISEAYMVYYNYTRNGYYYAALYSAFETAETVAENILQNAPAAITNIYYYMPMTVDMNGTMQSWTMDYALSYVRQLYGAYMNYITFEDVMLKDVYKNSGLQSFMIDVNYIFRIYLSYDETTYGTEYDTQTVLSLMSDFRSLTAEQRYLFLTMDTARLSTGSTMQYLNSLYYEALKDFFSGKLSTAAAEVAEFLLQAEFNYTPYEYNPTGINVDGYSTAYMFSQYMANAIESYNALSASDKAAFDSLLGDIYAIYLAAYEAM